MGRRARGRRASYAWAANHWLDCLVGCAAAASMLGATLFKAPPRKVVRKRKRVTYLS